jgi:hypothetical protein
MTFDEWMGLEETRKLYARMIRRRLYRCPPKGHKQSSWKPGVDIRVGPPRS